MKNILTYAQIGSAVLLVISILLQRRGSGLGGGIGGTGMEYSTKRGVEKSIFYATIVLAIVFIGVSIARLVLGA
jgi:preprotein translocase subunit SecG